MWNPIGEGRRKERGGKTAGIREGGGGGGGVQQWKVTEYLYSSSSK